ncbi:hypothetical protein LXA43DRAFT_1007469 [Ganoderma leucocontextum]|nr:hypothetical protein LXA43DRAFT_1007469 [Ganoderma leucocontextum]
MPIQDTLSPMTRDPNRSPATRGVSNASTITSSNARRPNRLTTVNLDVQTHIMSFLSRRDLSAFMRTCRYFLHACLLPLCARSGALLHDVTLAGVPSFCRFLRINAGPSSRAHLIKELWIAVRDTQYRFHKLVIDRGLAATRRHWSAAFLDILRHCSNVRRLRIDLWFDDDTPFPLFVNTLTLLEHLEDLTLYLPQRLQDAEVNTLRKLAPLPLRNLAFLKCSEISPRLEHAPVPLEGLPRSLVRLDIDVCTPVDDPFPMVQTLGVRVATSHTFVADATAAFPNLTQLILRRHVRGDLCFGGPDPLIYCARTHNKIQWQSQYREAWPSLSAVWVVDLCMLYTVGFSRQIPSISIPFRKQREETYVAPVLADTSPSFLELRVAIDHHLPIPPVDWQSHFGPSASSVLRLKFLFETENHDRPWDDDLTEGLFDDLCAMLSAFRSLTHMLIKFTPMKTPYYPDVEWPPLFREEALAVEAAIQKYLPLFAKACGSLQWVAFDVYDMGLQCWEISRAGGGEEGQGKSSLWTKTSNNVGMEVLRREGMDAFGDVRPLLITVWSRLR